MPVVHKNGSVHAWTPEDCDACPVCTYSDSGPSSREPSYGGVVFQVQRYRGEWEFMTLRGGGGSGRTFRSRFWVCVHLFLAMRKA